MKQLLLDPALLLPNPWNSNIMSPENEAKLETSISRFGMFKPVVVRELEDGKLEIIGGEHRAMIAQRMGHKEIPVVNLGRIDDRQAKEISLVDNGRYGVDDSVSLAEILVELGRDVEDFMPFTDSEFELITSSLTVELDDFEIDEKDEPNHGEVTIPKAPKTHTIMRFKVPVEDAARIAEIIGRTQKDHGFTAEDELTNAGDALVQLLLTGNKDGSEEEEV